MESPFRFATGSARFGFMSHSRATGYENVRTTATVVRTHRITQLLVIGGTSLSQASMGGESEVVVHQATLNFPFPIPHLAPSHPPFEPRHVKIRPSQTIRQQPAGNVHHCLPKMLGNR